jgi:hypothetical protein
MCFPGLPPTSGLKEPGFSGYNSRLDDCRQIFGFAATQGGIAQLGERLHGMQEVIGSIPFTSTNFFPESVSGLFGKSRREEILKRVFCQAVKSLSGKFQGSDPIV